MIYKTYDYSDEISDDIIQAAIKDINFEIETNVNLDAPFFQTKFHLFKKKGNHWKVLKETFDKSLFNTFNIDDSVIVDIDSAWAYVNKIGYKQSKHRWHTHVPTKYSGVMYLQLPTNSKGTLFEDENKNIVEVKPKLKQWILFESKVKHAPPVWDHISSDKNRICLAVTAIERIR